MDWITKNGSEDTLPNLHYTTQQLFWLSMARTWCTKLSTATMKQLIKTDKHAPDNYRVIGTLQNNEVFAKDFHCKVGSYMNPAGRCPRIW